jgi:hypothetical protein
MPLDTDFRGLVNSDAISDQSDDEQNQKDSFKSDKLPPTGSKQKSDFRKSGGLFD